MRIVEPLCSLDNVSTMFERHAPDGYAMRMSDFVDCVLSRQRAMDTHLWRVKQKSRRSASEVVVRYSRNVMSCASRGLTD